ncbi:hypothetical protein CHS0354_012889 [Potamilus streckersoni]|uniref:Uncharacterized protein n=1 Tax=Potamilus streckersoni TaxID=2493646 RepID=A0AAE0VSG6_9BIVA|nr:hypothetical protein CHS0354_012889 [Potamilus streckersoni]
MSTAEANKSVDVTKFEEDVKGVAQSECFVKTQTGHPEHVAEECKINFADQNKNMTMSSENDTVNDNRHYVNIDEIVTDLDSCITQDVLSENMKTKPLQEHVTHSNDETKYKKKEKKLHFFTFGKNKTKHTGKVRKNKQSKCEKTKEEFVIVKTDLSEKDSSKSKEVHICVGSETLLVSKTYSEYGRLEAIPPPSIFVDLSMQEDCLNSEAIESKVVYRDYVFNNSVNVRRNSDDTSKMNGISWVMKHDDTVCSGIHSEHDSVSGLFDPSSKPSILQSEKQNQTRKDKNVVDQKKANTNDKKKRWSFNFGDSRKKQQNVDGGITYTNGKESEKKHGKFKRLGIRALSQPKIDNEDSITSSLPEDEKEDKMALKKSRSTLKSLKTKDHKKREERNRRKSMTNAVIEHEENRSSLTTVEESWETDKRRKSLILDDELGIEESDAFEGVSLSSLDENDANQRKELQALPQETVNQKGNVQRNVSCQEKPSKEDAFADVIAQQILEAVVEAVNTQSEQSVKSSKKPVIPQISAQQSVDCLKDIFAPSAATLLSSQCADDCIISTGTVQKPEKVVIVQQTSKSANDVIDAAKAGLSSVHVENDDGKIEDAGDHLKSVQRVDNPASKSVIFGNDTIMATVSVHTPTKFANDVIHSSKTENYLACTRDTTIHANTTKLSSDLEKKAAFVTSCAKKSSPLKQKTAHSGFINPQILSFKTMYSNAFTDGISRKGNVSCVAPTGLVSKKERKVLLSYGQLNSNERDKNSVVQGIPIPCIHEAVQTVLERRERISSEREKKLHSKITEDEKICLTSTQMTSSLQDKPMLHPENVLHKNHKGKVKTTYLKNQIPYETGGNEGLLSDNVVNIVSTHLSEKEDIQDMAPDAKDEKLNELKISKALSLPITDNKSSLQGKVQICKDVGVQAPDVYLPLDDVFGFRSVPAENCRHVGVQFPEKLATYKDTDQRSSNYRLKSFYI